MLNRKRDFSVDDHEIAKASADQQTNIEQHRTGLTSIACSEIQKCTEM